MDRKEAKELLPVIQAFVEGKIIEVLDPDLGWIETDDPAFIVNSSFYRIKPETKYRPFSTIKECWEEMKKHHYFGWLKTLDGAYIQITGIRTIKNEPSLTLVGLSGIASLHPKHVFEEFTFADGTPFGIKEE